MISLRDCHLRQSLFQPFFLFQLQQERSKEKSPSANPHSARPVVPEKCLPRIQAIFPSLPVGKTGLPHHPPWRTVPSLFLSILLSNKHVLLGTGAHLPTCWAGEVQ